MGGPNCDTFLSTRGPFQTPLSGQQLPVGEVIADHARWSTRAAKGYDGGGHGTTRPECLYKPWIDAFVSALRRTRGTARAVSRYRDAGHTRTPPSQINRQATVINRPARVALMGGIATLACHEEGDAHTVRALKFQRRRSYRARWLTGSLRTLYRPRRSDWLRTSARGPSARTAPPKPA